MPGLILVSRSDLTPELGQTVLWRGDVQRTRVEDPEGTFQAARLQRPRLIVLDAQQPRLTADLISRLRADPETRPSAIVVICRSPSLEEEEAFRRVGANAVVRPPVDPLFWDGRLEELLSSPGAGTPGSRYAWWSGRYPRRGPSTYAASPRTSACGGCC